MNQEDQDTLNVVIETINERLNLMQTIIEQQDKRIEKLEKKIRYLEGQHI